MGLPGTAVGDEGGLGEVGTSPAGLATVLRLAVVLPCRRIVVSGVEVDVFRLFLQYLYGAPLDAAAMATDTLVDLMAVADRLNVGSACAECK